MHDTVAAKILRLRVLTQLSLFSAAIQQLHELLNGIGLPQGSTHSTRPAESTSVRTNLHSLCGKINDAFYYHSLCPSSKTTFPSQIKLTSRSYLQ